MTKNGSTRVFSEANGYQPRALVEAARDHMRSSLVLFNESPYCYDSAGYLAHLSIELLLKALLLEITGSFPAEHSVRRLSDLLREQGAEFHSKATKILNLLDEFNELRYPRPKREVEIGLDDREPIVQMYNSLWAAVPDDARPGSASQECVTKGTRVLMRRAVASPSVKRLQPSARGAVTRRRG